MLHFIFYSKCFPCHRERFNVYGDSPPQNSWESGAELITRTELDNEAYAISRINHRIINNYSSSQAMLLSQMKILVTPKQALKAQKELKLLNLY